MNLNLWELHVKKDAAICLSSMDKPFKIFGYDQSIILSKLFFPEAYKDGLKLYSYVEELWKAFEVVKQQNNIQTDQILMKHFMDTIIYCFRQYGAYNKQLYAPTTEEWIASIIGSGFVISQI